MIPSIGRIVHYTLTQADADEINRRRADAAVYRPHDEKIGYTVHVGNGAKPGDIYPMIITRLWTIDPREDSVVQGQVFLDGNDTLWVTSVSQGDGERQWHAPPRTATAKITNTDPGMDTSLHLSRDELLVLYGALACAESESYLPGTPTDVPDKAIDTITKKVCTALGVTDLYAEPMR